MHKKGNLRGTPPILSTPKKQASAPKKFSKNRKKSLQIKGFYDNLI